MIFSDSHGELSNMRTAIERERPDYIFHLGDHDRDAEDLSREYPILPITGVRGNCDYWTDTPVTRCVSLGGIRFFLCHGHTYGVKSSVLRASYAAREQGADVLLYGHTHTPDYDKDPDSGLILLNPGACGYGPSASYGRIIIQQGEMDIRLLKCK